MRQRPSSAPKDWVDTTLCGPFCSRLDYAWGRPLASKWDDVEVEARSVSVRRSVAWVGSQPALGPPKTGTSVRDVALPEIAVQSLVTARVLEAGGRLRAGGAWRDDRGAVFTTRLGDPPSSGVLWRAFQKDCLLAGVLPMRIHDLRHVHATLAVASGADPKTVQARLGHASLAMTLGVYAHRVVEAENRLVEAFDRMLGERAG